MNFCRELHSVLFCAWGNKRAQHAESRRAVHLRGDVPLLHLRVAEFCLVLCWMKAALGTVCHMEPIAVGQKAVPSQWSVHKAAASPARQRRVLLVLP